MDIGLNVNYMARKSDLACAAAAAAKAGLNGLDYTPNYRLDEWESIMHEAMSIFEKNGLYVLQTHAPYNRYGAHGENHMKFVDRTLTATKEMGAKYMVVHGDEFDFKNMEYTFDAALEYNYEKYAPVVEKAARLGVKVAFENVFQEASRPRFCSKSEELLGLIKRFNSDTVCACWDFGHAGVSFGKDQPQKILELGSFIECTHVHDNAHNYDCHLPPFLGEIDWDACCESMRSIGYKGHLTFEMVYGNIPGEMIDVFANYLMTVGKLLRFQ